MKVSEFRIMEQEFEKKRSLYAVDIENLQKELVDFVNNKRPDFYSEVVHPIVEEVKEELKKLGVFESPVSQKYEPSMDWLDDIYEVIFKEGKDCQCAYYYLSVRNNSDGSIAIGGGFKDSKTGYPTPWKHVNELTLSDVMEVLHPHGDVKPLHKSSLFEQIQAANDQKGDKPIRNECLKALNLLRELQNIAYEIDIKRDSIIDDERFDAEQLVNQLVDKLLAININELYPPTTDTLKR